MSPNAGSPQNLAPCPYHIDRQPCGHEKICPLLTFNEYVICTTLSPHDIAFVRAAVVGHAVGRIGEYMALRMLKTYREYNGTAAPVENAIDATPVPPGGNA